MASSSLPVCNVVLSRSRNDAADFSYLLCKSLTSEGIRVFRGEDGQEVEGDTTTTSQELTIKESIRFAIVILSGNYASSPRLLEELSQILERKRVSGISVLPVFHDVKPSDVEEQTGVFGESFNKNVQVFKEDPEKVRRWRNTLKEVANLPAWSSENRNEIEIIEEIVNSIRELLLPSTLTKLRGLDLYGCKLENISLFGHRFRQLETLFVQKKTQLGTLRMLCLSQYKLEDLPREILQLPHLQLLRSSDYTRLTINRKADISSRETRIDIKDHEDREGTTNATSSAEWNFLLTALVLEIFSAAFDQASSPSKPHYALIGMLLAITAVLACTWELIHKGSLKLNRWQQLGCIYYLHPSHTLFDSLPDIYGLVSSISQCVFSTVQYIYFSHHVDSPIKLSLLPAIFLLCLAGSRLYRNQRPSS